MKKALIYHTDINPATATPDDLDVLNQAKFVSGVLTRLGYEPVTRPFALNFPDKCNPATYNPQTILMEIGLIQPQIIFNLVEVVNGQEPLNYIAPEVFEQAKVPYAGCTHEAFLKVADKLTAKRIMRINGIPTPAFLTPYGLQETSLGGKAFLVKSATQHASQGLETTLCRSKGGLRRRFEEKGKDFFAEEYIEGREFNISVMGRVQQPKVLPIAEMMFQDWEKGKPKIVGYSAKWDPNCREYKSTEVRRFDFPEADQDLIHQLETICRDCWNIFDLRGYARIDFRVSEQGQPYVLEINANPCISPDAGFIVATERAEMTHEQTIKEILEASLN